MALDAIDYERKDDFKVSYPKKKDVINDMVDCPYFKTDYIELSKDMELDVSDRDSFTIYMCVGGSVSVGNDTGETNIQRGETVLVPANTSKIFLKSNGAKLLEVTV